MKQHMNNSREESFRSQVTPAPFYRERLEAFKRGDMIGRPMVSVQYVPPGAKMHFGQGFYYDRVFGDSRRHITSQIEMQRMIWRGGETSPGRVSLSLGPDECAAFCGADIAWSDAHPDTNWSVPCVDEWLDFMPLSIKEDSPYWQRSLELYLLAAYLTPEGWRLNMPDLHSNIDLLAAVRDPLTLCLDLVDTPETMDLLFAQTVDVVRTIHDRLSVASRRLTLPATLQSDFCCLLSPEMFRRWIAPILEAEADIVGESAFHWDGQDAIKHLSDICSIDGIYAVSYVPGAGHGTYVDYMDLYREVQAHGIGVVVSGSPEEIKWMYAQLDPAKTIFSSSVSSRVEGEALLEWFDTRTDRSA